MSADSSTRLARTLERLEHFGVKLGLERERRVLGELGSPERRLAVVLVAGTNGKGSVSSWLASIATAAGYRSGLFTSPHLERVEERLRIDGRAISSERLEALVDRVVAASRATGEEVVTFFEALTAAALCWFAEREVDIAVLEVGLGGRLDATNVTDPLLSVITSIDLDHQKQLGETLDRIAREKAGILRPDRPAVASTDKEEVRSALATAAAEIGAHLELYGPADAEVEAVELGERGQLVELRTGRAAYRLRSRLGGRHQLDNLRLAVRAAELLADTGFSRIGRRAIEEGIAACAWPGRLEWIALGEAGEVLLDGAHNPAGLRVLTRYLRSLGQPFSLVFGMLREKVDPEVVADLWGLAEVVAVTRPDSDRALEPAELAAMVGVEPDFVTPDAGRGLRWALDRSELTVVCGSLYLVGELRGWLRERYGVPDPVERLFTSPPAASEPAVAVQADEATEP